MGSRSVTANGSPKEHSTLTHPARSRGDQPGSGQTSHDRKLSSGNLRVRWPGDLLVVSLATDQTAMEYTNQAIGEGAERLVMRLALGALAVVEGACSG
jgi:hypothetical protein